MNTTLRNQIIDQIQEADEVILLEIQELLNLQNQEVDERVLPEYVRQRIEKSIAQSQDSNLIAHESVMKKYNEWK